MKIKPTDINITGASSGYLLTYNGTIPTWAAPATSGTVTSVSGSGGTTGLTLTGGPITGSGTLTLGGTLAVANGGTGATTAAGARTNLGAVNIAGDTMTGSLNIQGSCNLFSGNFTVDSAAFLYSYAGGSIGTVRAGFQFDGTSKTLNFYTDNTFRGFFDSAGNFRIQSGVLDLGGNTVIDASQIFRLRQYTVATLPTAGTAGRLAAVTDALGPTYGVAVVGGGTVNTPVYDNGTNWTCR